MALFTSTTYALTTFFFLFLLRLHICNSQGGQQTFVDHDYLDLALNLEYLETEFFLFGALGHGMDNVAPGLSMGGPPPIGARKANLFNYIQEIIHEFGLQEVGHLRAIKENVKGFPRPQLDLSKEMFASTMNKAINETLNPPFDPYFNTINYLLASYVIPYVGLTGYVGAASNLVTPTFKKLVSGLLGVESGQDAVIRSLLYEFRYVKVTPYEYNVMEFTEKISALRNNLGGKGIKDEGIIVDPSMGAEGNITTNVLVGNVRSVSFDRTPVEILRIVYGTGNERKFGGFFPKGAGGKFAKSFLSSK